MQHDTVACLDSGAPFKVGFILGANGYTSLKKQGCSVACSEATLMSSIVATYRGN